MTLPAWPVLTCLVTSSQRVCCLCPSVPSGPLLPLLVASVRGSAHPAAPCPTWSAALSRDCPSLSVSPLGLAVAAWSLHVIALHAPPSFVIPRLPSLPIAGPSMRSPSSPVPARPRVSIAATPLHAYATGQLPPAQPASIQCSPFQDGLALSCLSRPIRFVPRLACPSSTVTPYPSMSCLPNPRLVGQPRSTRCSPNLSKPRDAGPAKPLHSTILLTHPRLCCLVCPHPSAACRFSPRRAGSCLGCLVLPSDAEPILSLSA